MAVKGAKALERNLKLHNQLAIRSLEAILHTVAPIIAQSMMAKAPLDIASHIEIETTEKSKRRVKVAIGPDKSRWYARFWEYGTSSHKVVFKNKKALKFNNRFATSVRISGIRKHPFVRPSIDENEQRVIDAAKAAVKDLFKL